MPKNRVLFIIAAVIYSVTREGKTKGWLESLQLWTPCQQRHKTLWCGRAVLFGAQEERAKLSQHTYIPKIVSKALVRQIGSSLVLQQCL